MQWMCYTTRIQNDNQDQIELAPKRLYMDEKWVVYINVLSLQHHSTKLHMIPTLITNGYDKETSKTHTS